MRNKDTVKAEIERVKKRLELYYGQEENMLSNGTQAYTIGSRSLQRYNTSLAAIQEEIKRLESRLEELNAELNGCGARKAVSAVPRDW